MQELRIIAATGMIGYGFPETSLKAALDLDPAVIGGDGGSCDPGPYYLGRGVSFTSRKAVKRDLGLMLAAARSRKIPMIVGSAGGAGGAPHLTWTREIIEEIAREQGLHFRMAIIQAEQGKREILKALRAGRIGPLGPVPELTAQEVKRSKRIVAMMGVEPIVSALEAGAEVVVAGRCTDAAIFAAVPLQRGFAPALAWHLGKILECGASVAEPKLGSDCLVGFLQEDGFAVECPNPKKRCTKLRVAGHTLYENSDPWRLREPGGLVDTSACIYTQYDAHRVRVEGSRWIPAAQYAVKLEGAARCGYRAICVAGVRDPVLLQQIDDYIHRVHEAIRERTQSIGVAPEDYRVKFRLYGKNGVMGASEPCQTQIGHEVGIVIDTVAHTQSIADEVLAITRALLLHTDFPGRLCIAGNLAFPYSPSDIPTGPVYRFNVWHLLEIDDPLSMFPMELLEV